jgi:Putative prokaryotic signal transducing protein
MTEEPESESESIDPSHDLDMVAFFSSSNHDAEMEAMSIHSILEANGIPSVLVGTSTIPSLEFQVQVSREDLEQARRVVAEAQAAGPDAAAEAEANSEQP